MKQIIGFFLVAAVLSSCSDNSAKQAEVQQARQMDSLKTEIAKKQIIDSMNAVNAAKPVMITNERTIVTSSGNTATRHSSPTTTSTTRSETNISSSNAATAPAPQKRKGMSAGVTGAIIGAGAGGITGALVDKKKGEGALVGGVLGAAAGGGVGAIIDKKKKEK